MFSDGLSENDRKSLNERVHKFYSSALVFAGTLNLFSPTSRGVSGAYSDPFCENCETGNTPKEWFLSKKRPKEGERVARGHFRERVDESLGQYENFVTSGSQQSRFRDMAI